MLSAERRHPKFGQSLDSRTIAAAASEIGAILRNSESRRAPRAPQTVEEH